MATRSTSLLCHLLHVQAIKYLSKCTKVCLLLWYSDKCTKLCLLCSGTQLLCLLLYQWNEMRKTPPQSGGVEIMGSLSSFNLNCFSDDNQYQMIFITERISYLQNQLVQYYCTLASTPLGKLNLMSIFTLQKFCGFRFSSLKLKFCQNFPATILLGHAAQHPLKHSKLTYIV